MSVRTIIGGVGAAVGFAIGGPAGAQWGWAIGSVAGNIVDPMTVRGPSIGEIAQQTSQEGGSIPIVFGTSPPITGNVIATGPPNIVEQSSGGKGGPTVVTESVFRTYAIGVCEGPVAGFVRVWRNNILVYDASGDELVSEEDNDLFLETARFFLGTYDQMPSPDLEAIFGVGTTAAHRGIAYMVMADENVTDVGGAIPQWQFQVGTAVAGSEEDYQEDEYLLPGDYEWEKEPDAIAIEVLLIGGGGAGKGGTASAEPAKGGGGGGGGGKSMGRWNAVDLPDTVTITVGAAGDPGPGSDGGDTLFGGFLTGGGGITCKEDPEDPAFDLNPGGTSEQWGTPVSFEGHYDGALDGGIGGTSDNSGDNPEVVNGANNTSGALRDVPTAGGGGGMGGGSQEIDVIIGEITVQAPGVGGGGGAGTAHPVVGGGIGSGGPSNGFPQFGGGGGSGGVPFNTVTEYSVEEGDFDPYFWNIILRSLNPAGGTDGTTGGSPGGGGGGGSSGLVQPEYAFEGIFLGDPALIIQEINIGARPGGFGGVGYAVVRQFFDVDSSGPAESCLSLQALVSSVCLRAGIAADHVDVTMLPDVCVPGLMVTNQYEASQALVALSQIYLFDASAYDSKIHFIPRGENSVATITEEDMVEDDDEIEQSKRADSISIPRILNLNYFDIDQGGLTSAKQTSERSGDRRNSANASIQSAVVMTADTAAQAVDISHKVMIEESKGELKFSLPDSFLELVAADPIIVQREGRSERVRIVQLDILDGFQSYVCFRDRQSAYTSDVEGLPPPAPTPPVPRAPGPTLLVPLDIPLLRDSDDNAGMILYFAVAGVAQSWPGALVELSYDGGTTYVESNSATVAAVIGELTEVLEDHPWPYPDLDSEVTVRLDSYGASLAPTDLAGMLNRVNLAAIGSPQDGWELINFADAVEDSNGEWVLSNLLRGRKATGTRQHPIGAQFVLLDRTFIGVDPMSVSDVNRTLTFRATSFGLPADQGTIVEMVYEGWAQIERPAFNLQANRVADTLTATWQGVGRLGAASSATQGLRFTGYSVTLMSNEGTQVFSTTDEFLEMDVAGLTGTLFVSVAQNNSLTGDGEAIWWPYQP